MTDSAVALVTNWLRLGASGQSVLAFGAVAVWWYWSWTGGGVDPGSWGGGGIVLVLLLVVALAGARPLRTGSRERVVALVALIAFCAWNFASIAWADVRGDAWSGSDQTLLYACGFAIFALWRWRPQAALVLPAVYALGVAAIGARTLAAASTGGNPLAYLQDGRILPPIGYVNGNVGLWMTGFWAAVFVGCVREVPIAARALLAAAATLLLDLSVLGQSRGWFFLLPVFLVAALLLAPRRLRLLGSLALPSIAALVAFPHLNAVYERIDHHQPLGNALHDAGVVVLISAVAVGLAAAGWAAADRRVRIPNAPQRAIAAVLLAATVAGVAALAYTHRGGIEHPGRSVRAHWADFIRGYPVGESTVRFTGSLGSDRYQEWVVAWKEFERHPLQGVGTDNYAAAYLLQRKAALIEPRYPHSLPLRLLSELGIVGTLLFVVFAAAAVTAALRVRRRLPTGPAMGVAACLAIFFAWLAYGSIDWFWEIPALAGPAIGLLGLAASIDPEDGPPGRRLDGRLSVAAACAAAAVGVVAIAPPWASFHYERAGVDAWRVSPARSYRLLDRAASLNPLSDSPQLLEGSIALHLHDLPRARAALQKALERTPTNWYTNFQLALAYAEDGRFGPASTYIRRAVRLNPREPIVAEARRQIRRHRPVDSNRLNAKFLAELNRRLMGNPRL
jgi:hypothetical protein